MGAPGDIDTSARNPLGTERRASDGAIYKYLRGAPGTVAGTWVAAETTGRTAAVRTSVTMVGTVALATAATGATTWGWYGIDGVFPARAASAAPNARVFATATKGVAADAVLEGAQITPAVWRAAAADGLALVEVHRAYCAITGTGPPEPEAPVLTALEPANVTLGSPSFTVQVRGTGFTPASVIVWNGSDEATTYVSATEVTTGINMATAEVPVSVPVEVRTGEEISNTLAFTFIAA